MKYTESNTVINAELMMPRSEYDPETYFEFTIEGKNTHNKDLYYEILINHGEDHETRKTRLDDKFLRFRLEEIVGNQVTPVIEEGTYEEIDNTTIWVNKIDANTTDKVEITYKLYMWITDEVNISAGGDYTNEVWNNDVFASIKVNVNGDFEEKKVENGEPAIEVVKATLGLTGGIIGVKEDASGNVTKETTDTGDLREYRYSGLNVNNYVYFNCEDGKEQNAANCEVWRIVGIFKDEEGTEHLKIVKNEILKYADFPATYTVNGTKYEIRTSNSSFDNVYWNNNMRCNNDWAVAGLQYWLNSEHDDTTRQGYLRKIKTTAKRMIEEKTKYYLGTVTYNNSDGSYKFQNTPNQAYKNERAVSECEEGKGPLSNKGDMLTFTYTPNCRIWANHAATWEGSVALLYPSDYGYSADSEHWNTILGNGTFNGIPSNSSWLQKEANHSGSEWLLSPTSLRDTYVSSWDGSYLGSWDVYSNADNVRPCLYLKSEAKIIDGDGTEGNAYQLSL